MMIKRAALLTQIGIMTAVIGGCDLFSTRSTEPPLNSGSAWIYPIQVEIVFQNMAQAIIDLNADNYLRGFFTPDDPVGPFLFIPNPNAVWPHTEPWGYEKEEESIEYLFSLLSPGASGFLMFDSGEVEQQVYGNEDSVRMTQVYYLEVPVNDPTLPQEVKGRADFYLGRNSTGYWAIYRWEDLEALDELPSWTDLRAGL